MTLTRFRRQRERIPLLDDVRLRVNKCWTIIAEDAGQPASMRLVLLVQNK